MPIKADYHFHSHHSGDSEELMENHIKKALELGFNSICFTEHHDIDFHGLDSKDDHFFELNTDSYLYELLNLRNKYYGQIDILFGVELGIQPHLRRELAIYSKSQDFDFIIASVHMMDHKDPYYRQLFDEYEDEEYFRMYFKEMYESLKIFSNFDVLGHLDYIVRYGKNMDKDYSYDKYKDLIDPILEKIIDMEKGLELNTAPIAKGFRSPNPCIEILKKYKDLGGEIITIGSDAHKAADLGANFNIAEDMLKECGFKYYTTFQNRVAEFHRL